MLDGSLIGTDRQADEEDRPLSKLGIRRLGITTVNKFPGLQARSPLAFEPKGLSVDIRMVV